MAFFLAANWQFSYETEGDGFPLILLPGMPGSGSPWTPYVPLLGELCRTITYDVEDVAPRHPGKTTVFSATQRLQQLEMLLAMFAIERCYLASSPASWLVALDFALQHATHVEGLVLAALDTDNTASFPALPLPCSTRLSTLRVPTLLVTQASAEALPESLETLPSVMPSCTHARLSSEAARQGGHTMMRFFMHRERQRNLVRGASFLL